MAKMAVNVVIDRRRHLDNGGRTWSIASVLVHIIAVCAVLLSSLYMQHRERSQPKVYRVSIATLSSGSDSNMTPNRSQTRAMEQAPAQPQPKPKQAEPVKKPAPKKPKASETKQAVGIDTSKQTKKKPEASEPEPPPLEDLTPATGRSGTGQAASSRVGFGNQGSVFDLDDANFEYSYYLGLVQGKIGSNWIRNYIGRGKVKVYFRISRTGKIVSAIIEQSSGDPGLDRMALRAVTASDPLPPLPEGYVGDVLGIHIWFNYEE